MPRIASIALIGSMAFGTIFVAGCDSGSDTTKTDAQKAADNTSAAADKTAAAVDKAADKTANAVDKAADKAADKTATPAKP